MYSNWVAQIEPYTLSWFLMPNFPYRLRQVLKRQVFALAISSPKLLATSMLATQEVLGLVEDQPIPDASDKSLKFHQALPSGSPEERQKISLDPLKRFYFSAKRQQTTLQITSKMCAMQNDQFWKINMVQHPVSIWSRTKPCMHWPQHAGPTKRATNQKNVNIMVQQGVVETAQSKWSFPVLLAPKSNGS